MVVDNFKGPFKRPFVIDDKCIGCGYCEKACPVQGRAAIEVYSIGEDRIKHGSYITERKKELRAMKESAAEKRRERRCNGFRRGSGDKTGSADNPGAEPADQQAICREELPKGFSQ